jgi:hypothetical protein
MPSDAAALKREAHMRAPIVEGEGASAVVDDKDRTMATVHNEPPLELQLLKAARQRKFLARRFHEHTLGPLQVLHNIGIVSRKGERMPWGLRKKGANCHDEMAKGISKMRYKRSHLFQSIWRSLYAI